MPVSHASDRRNQTFSSTGGSKAILKMRRLVFDIAGGRLRLQLPPPPDRLEVRLSLALIKNTLYLDAFCGPIHPRTKEGITRRNNR
jgi:hypothetical protein